MQVTIILAALMSLEVCNIFCHSEQVLLVTCCHFNSHFLGEPGLAGFPRGFLLPFFSEK